ncbi:MAG: class II glutamine amidotransferase [Oscillospiraceae bacterium]|nr:class II glutamine amidotransferase [Oscillospiraceae bacterium]
MCELFAASLRKPSAINEYLERFYSHSADHPHGWGLACINKNNVIIEKEPLRADKSHYLKERLSVPVSAPIVLAHIRYATIGHMKYENCHPYIGKDKYGRSWTLIHNGTIFDYPPLSNYKNEQSGDTDSERVLLYIIDNINKNNAQTPEKRIETIEQAVEKMAPGNKLNLILFDGEQLYVHTNYKNSLYYRDTDNGIFISTTPLDDSGWVNVPFTRVLVYKDSELIFTAKNHGKEYVDNIEDTKYLYQIFSDL